jgi:NhaP-type Na+/H+ or K+/H+ antiporter
MSPIVLGFALLAIVLTVSALASGLVERAPLSFPMIFLGLGLLMGARGLLPLDVHHPALESIATLSLALVLFLDAVNMQVDELRQDWLVPLLTLGPGTLLTIAGAAGAASLLLGTPPLQALLLGAILASTDPVVLRDVLRNDQIPRSVRRALGVEAGMNDLVVVYLYRAGNSVACKTGIMPPFHHHIRGQRDGITPLFLPAGAVGSALALLHVALCVA